MYCYVYCIENFVYINLRKPFSSTLNVSRSNASCSNVISSELEKVYVSLYILYAYSYNVNF